MFFNFEEEIFNSIQDGSFRSCSRMGWPKRPPLPKICHTYPTVMKLGTIIPNLKKTQKIYGSRDRTLKFCWHQHLAFFESLKIFLINMIAILMIPGKLATPGLLKIKIFQNEDYDVIIRDYGVTNKILSTGSNCIVDVAMWPKFGNSSISMRKVTITLIL